MNIGEVIKSRRKRRNITQAELAELLSVTPQTVSRWEVGISYPDIAMLPQLATVLRVSADELLGIGREDSQETGNAASAGPILSQSQVDSIFYYSPKPPEGKGKKILVADDSDFMRMMLENILSGQGHTVLQAKDGQECLDILQNEPVEVCVLDIAMPHMDGTEVLRKIRESQPELKVVMLSALATERVVKLTLELGADAFVVKPFHESCLIERVG